MSVIYTIPNHAVLFSGFSQSSTRAVGLNMLMHRLYHTDFGKDIYVHLVRTWNVRPRKVVEQLRNAGAQPGGVVLIGYSWGCPTARRVAELLGDTFDIPLMVWIDPVRRPLIGKLLAAFPEAASLIGPMTVPPNVRECLVFRQTNNRPRAWPVEAELPHRLPEDDGTKIVTVDLTESGLTHQTIDNASVVHETVVRAVTEAFFER